MFSNNFSAKTSAPDRNEFGDVSFDYKSLFAHLEKKYGVVSEFVSDTKGVLRCLYFQDSFMKDWLNFFPDRLCIDVTSKYFNTSIFMYLFIAEDSNGKNDIVSLGFAVSDDSDSLSWLLNIFKKHNPNWRRTKIIVADSEIKQRDVIRSTFPSPYILICSYHALKSFAKAIENFKQEGIIPSEQVEIAVDLFKNMYFAHTQAEYELYHQQFLMLHSSIVSYFEEVWMPIQYLWRTGLDFYRENVFYSLNFHLEHLDNTFKTVFLSENCLVEFIKKSFLVLSLKRNEKVNMVLYTNPVLFSRFSPEHQISKILTPYAAKFVIDQFDLSCDILMDCSVVSDNYFFDNFGAPVNASATICSCQFFSYTLLPCRHVFAVRKTLSLCIFDESLTEHTWSMKYHQSAVISMQGCLNNNSLSETGIGSVPKSDMVSHLMELALPTFLESPESVFNSKIEILNQLVVLWKSCKDVYLQFEGVEKKLSYSKSICSPEKYFKFPSVPVECKLESPSPVDPLMEKDTMLGIQIVDDITYKQNKWNFKSKVLDGKHINYAYLGRVICDSKESCFNWLQQMELIPTSMMCPSCNCEMIIKNVPRLSDGAVWVCSTVMENKRSCSRRCSVRQGSWFELTNMTFEQILTFCYMWINGFNQSQIISETGVSTATYVSWNKLNKRVCEEFLLEDNNYSLSSKTDSSIPLVLETWLNACSDEDAFLKFLQDANTMHRKDSLRHIMR